MSNSDPTDEFEFQADDDFENQLRGLDPAPVNELAASVFFEAGRQLGLKSIPKTNSRASLRKFERLAWAALVLIAFGSANFINFARSSNSQLVTTETVPESSVSIPLSGSALKHVEGSDESTLPPAKPANILKLDWLQAGLNAGGLNWIANLRTQNVTSLALANDGLADQPIGEPNLPPRLSRSELMSELAPHLDLNAQIGSPYSITNWIESHF
ncbi:MAG: hypothetical protein KDB03_02545 [Planctomycetales bacterium]|nr:hypothetical protein [Planctomycetales bacterium]